MRVIYGIGPLERGPRGTKGPSGSKGPAGPKVLTVGVFDGVHRGHRAILERLRRAGRKARRLSAVVTFARHPSITLEANRSVRHLTSLTHKLLLLERAGIDCCYVLAFDRRLARLTAEAFVRDILVKKLKVAALYVGEGFLYGRGRRGGVASLRAAARRYGFCFTALRRRVFAGRPISSTRIRALVEKGDIAAAQRLLGRRVSLLGCVVRGEGRGRRLGFPTANLAIEHEALVPDGVYAGRGRLCARPGSGRRPAPWTPCAVYVGRKPTFYPDAGRVVEVHFWRKGLPALRGRLLEVELIRRLRPDRRFAKAGDLVVQMRRDVLLAKGFLKRFS